jgi:hypothetical protein
MLKRALILMTLAMAQVGCSIEEGGGAYEPVPMTTPIPLMVLVGAWIIQTSVAIASFSCLM